MKKMISDKINALPVYPFAEIDRTVKRLKSEGADVIDFGVGDPQVDVHPLIRDALISYINGNPQAGYPSYQGSYEYRLAIASWFKQRFGVDLDPETEVASSIGSKEAVFNFHHAVLNAGDYVLVPTPGYPPYSRGAAFCGGRVWFYPVSESNSWLPDFSKVPEFVLNHTKLLWITQPHAPTGKALSIEDMRRILDFSDKEEASSTT